MRGDSAIGGLSINFKFDWLSVTPEDPTIEVPVKVMGGELSMIAMSDMAAEDTGHTGIVLQWGDQIHQPHAISGDGVLRDESDILPLR